MCQPCAVTVLPSLIFVPYVRIMVRMAGERQLTPREGTIYVVFVTACVLHELNTQSHTGSFVILVCMFEKITEEAYWRLIRGSTQSVLSVPVTPDGNSHVLALSTHTTKCRQACSPSNPNTFLSGKLPVVSFPYLLTILFQLVCLTRDPTWCHTDSLLRLYRCLGAARRIR